MYECARYHDTFLVSLSLGNKVVLYCIAYIPRGTISCHRRLWQILDSIHYEVFNRDILPVLCEMYHYIIPARFWRIVDRTGPGSTGEGVQEGASAPPSARVSSEKCTRCAMRYRIRPFTLADFLFKTGAITRESYR